MIKDQISTSMYGTQPSSPQKVYQLARLAKDHHSKMPMSCTKRSSILMYNVQQNQPTIDNDHAHLARPMPCRPTYHALVIFLPPSIVRQAPMLMPSPTSSPMYWQRVPEQQKQIDSKRTPCDQVRRCSRSKMYKIDRKRKRQGENHLHTEKRTPSMPAHVLTSSCPPTSNHQRSTDRTAKRYWLDQLPDHDQDELPDVPTPA